MMYFLQPQLDNSHDFRNLFFPEFLCDKFVSPAFCRVFE